MLAVEGLSFDSFSCSTRLQQDISSQGFSTFCEEAVRFTHAYTTSALAAPALGSILTGLFPVEHGLRHHGSDFLSAEHKTLSEIAISKGFRTAMFSGGAPVLHKSGLGQGFEVFHDADHFESGLLAQRAESLADQFVEWMDRDRSKRTFSVLYFNDLQFPGRGTTNNDGEIRSETVNSQMAEVDETIGNLIDELKSSRRWDNTHVVLIGTNGGLVYPVTREHRGLNLYSSNVRVKMFYKPARKTRDKGLQWKVDRNVSFADMGMTLHEVLGTKPHRASQFGPISLLPAINSLDVQLPQDRFIPIESSWSSWRKLGIPRLSIRMDQYLYIYDRSLKLYNTIFDRMETSQIDLKDPLALDSLNKIQTFAKETGYQRWRPLPSTLEEKLRVGKRLYSEGSDLQSLQRDLKLLSIHRSWDDQVWGWRAKVAMSLQDWADLEKVGKTQVVPEWVFVASQNRKEPFKLGKMQWKGCAKFLKLSVEKPLATDCQDLTFRLFMSWVTEKDESKAERAKEKFLQTYNWEMIDKSAYELNYSNGLTWAVPMKKFSKPTYTELAMALPKFKSIKKQVDARLSLVSKN